MNRNNLILVLFVCVVVTLSSCVSGKSPGKNNLQIPTGSEAKCEMLEGNVEKITWDTDETLIWEAPLGDRVFFSFPLPDGESFDDYGLGKFDLKIEGGVVDVMVFIEKPGEKRRLYRPIDITIPPKGWQTIHLDLRQPEIILRGKRAPDYV